MISWRTRSEAFPKSRRQGWLDFYFLRCFSITRIASVVVYLTTELHFFLVRTVAETGASSSLATQNLSPYPRTFSKLLQRSRMGVILYDCQPAEQASFRKNFLSIENILTDLPHNRGTSCLVVRLRGAFSWPMIPMKGWSRAKDFTNS